MGDLAAQMRFQCAQRNQKLFALLGPLIADHRSANGTDSGDQRIVGHIAGGNHLDRFALVEKLPRLEFAEIGIAAAAGAENAGADRQPFEIVAIDGPRHKFSFDVMG